MLSNQQMLSSRTRARTTTSLSHKVYSPTRNETFLIPDLRSSNRQNKPKYTRRFKLDWSERSERNDQFKPLGPLGP